jgi:HPt (histidine-containing phosphotransfer) domain-containing protein
MTDAGSHQTSGPTLDPDALQTLRDALGDDELVVDITRTFLSGTPAQIDTLASAELSGDLPTLAATAHLIKGGALTFGAVRLVRLCAALEASPAESRGLVPAVAQEFDELSRALSSHVDELS